MALAPDGTLVIGSYATRRVVRLLDHDGNGSYDSKQTVANGLSIVHSVAFSNGQLYAAAQDRVVRLSDFAPAGRARTVQTVIRGLPYTAAYVPPCCGRMPPRLPRRSRLTRWNYLPAACGIRLVWPFSPISATCGDGYGPRQPRPRHTPGRDNLLQPGGNPTPNTTT
ncbi:MAG: hypothetical protein HC876_18465 [Chloroflexaceae bacterium]|nr:hypothetical protein [Chloroflexaceae bacterium]